MTDDAAHQTEEALIANLTEEDDCEGHWIKATVQPDGRTWTITNGRTGYSRSYQSKRRGGGRTDRTMPGACLTTRPPAPMVWSLPVKIIPCGKASTAVVNGTGGRRRRRRRTIMAGAAVMICLTG